MQVLRSFSISLDYTENMEISKVLMASILVASLSSVVHSAPVKRSTSDIQVLTDVISRHVKNATQEV